MRTAIRFLLILSLVLLKAELNAQVDTSRTLRIEDGKMILTLDLRWDALQRFNIANSYDIDSLAIEKAYKGVNEVVSGKAVWMVKKLKNNIIELSKSLDTNPVDRLNINDIFFVDDSWLKISIGAPPIQAKCGINKFKREGIFTYQNGIAQFFLPSNKKTKKVYLSGSFNSWSSLQTPMQLVDSGWIVKLKLKPGKYTYKYITDGKWREDPNNNIRERDTKGGYNSVIFCTNHEFHLKGRTNANRVIVAGSFNGWGFDEFRMIKTQGGWKLPIYLSEGTHAYKFIVDNQWITDPDNKDVRNDANGNLNSFIGLGESYLFKLKGYQSAEKVILSGSFNGWSENELVMEKTGGGWQFPYILAPGTYNYKFIVDGKWIIDPDNPLTTGTGNYMNSVLTFKANITLSLSGYSTARNVFVTGSFNGWDREGYKMYLKDGKWELPLFLNPGKYLYKFIVDGTWITDPDNKLWEENEYGTGNSVVWIDQ